MVTVSIAMMKDLDKSNLREKCFISPHHSRSLSIMVKNSNQQEFEGSGHIVSAVMKSVGQCLC